MHEFSLWAQIFRIGLEWRLYPDEHGYAHVTNDPVIYRQRMTHRKTKSEPPIKPAFYPKPLIEFCLNAKIYGITWVVEASESCAVVSLNSLNVSHHKHTETFGLMLNMDHCQGEFKIVCPIV